MLAPHYWYLVFVHAPSAREGPILCNGTLQHETLSSFCCCRDYDLPCRLNLPFRHQPGESQEAILTAWHIWSYVENLMNHHHTHCNFIHTAVTRILGVKISVPWTQIFTEKISSYGPLFENSVRVEDMCFKPSFSNRNDYKSRRGAPNNSQHAWNILKRN